MPRLRTATAVALALAAALPQAALAHTYLLRSEPAAGAVLKRAPREVRLEFNEAIRVARGNAVVLNGGGSVLAGPARVDPTNDRRLVLPLLGGLTKGSYSVRWRAISDDGHTVEGLFAFGIGTRAPPTVGLPALGTGESAANLIGRGLFLLGVLLCLGVASFGVLVWTPALGGASLTAREADALTAREARTTSIVLFFGFLLAQLGTVLAILEATTVTRYGRAHELAIVLAGIGAASTASSAAVARRVTLAAALALATVPALAGHSLDRGEPQPLSFVVDVIHVWAAGLWLGGLVQLAITLWFARSLEPAARSRLTWEVARRFSRVALVSVALIAATGLARAVVELKAVEQLWSTSYGRALLVKTGLLAALIVIAWLNRYRLVPRLRGNPHEAPSRRLRLAVMAELAILLALVATVAVLTSLRPGRASGAPQQESGPRIEERVRG